jgi:NADH-quinone oxidoreductase subunit G
VSGEEMVEVTINGRTVKAEQGRILIDVAEEMGIFVPRFCYHPGMKSVAVCRMCLVQIEGQNKLLPSCATPVTEGMKANTVDPSAVDAQKQMLEFLLINHPLDCPICDRGGECPLQDQTYRHGPGTSRYVDPKRSFEKPLAISDLVVLDRERCVLCWRCIRFSDEIAGDQFIQLVDRGPGTQILTFNDEPFDSYFSGNTIQICPVGALTSRPYRFLSRPWDLKSGPSVCAYCSVGCPLSNEVRSGQLVRAQALPNEHVNDFWNCDKGRFGYHYVSSEDRLTTPLMRNDDGEFEPTGWGSALSAAATQLNRGDRVGVIAGGHLMTEDAYAIARLAKRTIGTPHVDSRLQDEGAPYELALGLGPVAGSTATINDLEAATTIVWTGGDPKETLPVLYLRLRLAVLDHGAKLIVVAPRRISLDAFATQVVRCDPGGEAQALRTIADEGVGDGEQEGDSLVACWGPSSPGRDEGDVFREVIHLASAAGGKLLMCPPHAGSQGLIDMGVYPTLDAGYEVAGRPGKDTRAILEAAAEGDLDTLLLFGADPMADFPDRELAARALESGVFVIAIELLPTETVTRADIVFPSAAYAEREGTFTNLERRLQRLEPVLAPPGAATEPWDICARLARGLGEEWGWTDFSSVWQDIRREVPTHAGVDPDTLKQRPPTPAPYEGTGFEPDVSHPESVVASPGAQYPTGYRSGAPFQTGQNWPLSWELRAFEAKQRPGIIPAPPGGNGHKPPPESAVAGPSREAGEGSFALYTGRFIYDEGAMVSRSTALRVLQKKPFVEVNEVDAQGLDLVDGDEVVLESNGESARVRVLVSDISKGAVFIPYDQQGLKANRLLKGPRPVASIRKERDE